MKAIVHKVGNILQAIGLKKAVLRCYDQLLDWGSWVFYLHHRKEDADYIARFPAPCILDIDETLDEIRERRLSICRYGDGEFNLMDNGAIGFQSSSKLLAERLRQIICTPQDGLLVCIPGIFTHPELYTRENHAFWDRLLVRTRPSWYAYLNMEQLYGNTDITRCYMGIQDKEQSARYFQKLKLLWKGKKVILVEGEQSRLGVGNDLFDEVKNLKRLLCPATNAFAHYDTILKKTLKHSEDCDLILLAVGPTATVLAYDLAKSGKYVLDVGNVDNEYEWFLAGATKKIRNPLKFSMEVPGGGVTDACNDAQYTKEIVEKIEG